jgi:hypothetical protein
MHGVSSMEKLLFSRITKPAGCNTEQNPQEACRVLPLFAVPSKSTTVNTGAKSGEGKDQPKKISDRTRPGVVAGTVPDPMGAQAMADWKP